MASGSAPTATAEELRQLVEVLDHGVRTPLARLYGWTEVLADLIEDGAPYDPAVVERLRSSVSALTELVERVLIEAGKRLDADDHLDGPGLIRAVRTALAPE